MKGLIEEKKSELEDKLVKITQFLGTHDEFALRIKFRQIN
jgi:hypothetical protein